MSCTTNTPNQTEFEFFQELTAHPQLEICCGPVTMLGFTPDVFLLFQQIMCEVGMQDTYLDRYDRRVVDFGLEALTMCAKHWVEHSKVIGTKAFEVTNEYYAELAYSTFRLVCINNEWDYREVLNYTKTANSLRE